MEQKIKESFYKRSDFLPDAVSTFDYRCITEYCGIQREYGG